MTIEDEESQEHVGHDSQHVTRVTWGAKEWVGLIAATLTIVSTVGGMIWRSSQQLSEFAGVQSQHTRQIDDLTRRVDNIPERLARIEERIIALSATVDRMTGERIRR